MNHGRDQTVAMVVVDRKQTDNIRVYNTACRLGEGQSLVCAYYRARCTNFVAGNSMQTYLEPTPFLSARTEGSSS